MIFTVFLTWWHSFLVHGANAGFSASAEENTIPVRLRGCNYNCVLVWIWVWFICVYKSDCNNPIIKIFFKLIKISLTFSIIKIFFIKTMFSCPPQLLQLLLSSLWFVSYKYRNLCTSQKPKSGSGAWGKFLLQNEYSAVLKIFLEH